MTSPEDRQFSAHIAEYKKLRDEAVQRVVLQNNNIQHSLIATGVYASLLTALFPVGQTPQELEGFYWIAAITAFIYGLLIELLIGNWIYQVAMMYQILVYQVWRKTHCLAGLVTDHADLFRWDDNWADDRWRKIIGETRLLRSLQVGFLYGLVALSWIGNAALFIHDVFDDKWTRSSVVAVFEVIVLVVFFLLKRADKRSLRLVRKQLKAVRKTKKKR
jgi:membrane protein implicated in regulation of membrane protease activity